MNYYYDPILGLKYNYLGDLFIIDIEMLPHDIKLDAEQWMKYIRKIGISLTDTSPTSVCERIGQITEYPV